MFDRQPALEATVLELLDDPTRVAAAWAELRGQGGATGAAGARRERSG